MANREYYRPEIIGSVPSYEPDYPRRPLYGDDGYSRTQEVVYVEPEESDLGTGLSGGLRREVYGGGYSEGYGAGYGEGGYSERYRAGYGENQPGYASRVAYGPGEYESAEIERLEHELKVEKRRAHEAEAEAAAATAYALHERHERRKEDEELERYEPGSEHRHKHHFFSRD